MKLSRWLPLGIAVVFAACLAARSQPLPTPPDKRAADVAAIRAADDAFAKAAEAQDLDKCVASYMDDAVVFSPGSPAIIGKDNIREFFSRLVSGPKMHFTFSDVKVDVARSGDIAEDSGSFQVAVMGANGQTFTQSGRFVLVWKKQADGVWKIAADTSANEK